MKRIRLMLNILGALVFTFALASMAQAQATRTWVSGVGDDVNPCSRTAPCKTFAGAISKTAAGGEISVLDPGGFGTVTITKAITIDGGGITASILASGVPGVTINAPSTSRVVLRNLSIQGIGTGTFGIRYLAGQSVTVENVIISGFTNHGIQVTGPSGALFVYNTTIMTNNTTVSRGINIQPSSGTATAVIDNTRFERMFVGVYIGEGGRATIRNSVVTAMSYAGIVTEAVSGNAQTNIENCVISHNGIGIQSGVGPVITRISNVTINNNSTLGMGGAGAIVSFGNNSIFGNATDGAPTATTPQI